MSVYKRGKYWIVQFNYNKKTYTRSSKSSRKRDALELERQMRQQLVDTQILGHREHIKLHAACDALLSTSKDSGAFGTLVTATNRFKDYFTDIFLDDITNRDLSRWVEHERKRGIKDITIRLWSRQFNKICRYAKRLGYYTPEYEWGEWNIKDKPIRYLTDNEEQRILKELDPSAVTDPKHVEGRQAARDIFILMIDAGFRINEASTLQWADIDFDNGVIYLYRSKVSNDDFIPMTNRLRTTLLNRKKIIEGDYVFPGRNGGHKTIQNNRALEAAFKRAGATDISSHNLRKTFATRLLSRGAAITDVQHLLGHASVKTTERAYAAFVKNERFKQTIDLLDKPDQPKLKVVK
ncbi:MAG: site-specific integrase [Candidatus Thiodiazotropha sp.]